MKGTWSRRQIADRVELLYEQHGGKDFAAAVERFARDELDGDEREELRRILLERAGEDARHNRALDHRLEHGGWLRRTLGRVGDGEASRRRGR